MQEPASATNEAQILLNDAESFYTSFINHLPQTLIGLLLFVILYFAARPVSEWMVKVLAYTQQSELIKVVIRRIISAVIIIFGFYLFLRLAGLSEFAIALLSGTGVAGLIIGFAFKDIAENFMSSLLLSIQKPFRLGEVIEVTGHLGVVKQVTARATTLVDFDGNHIQIPNATVYKNTIRNLTANPITRGKFVVGVGYDCDPSAAQDIGLEALNTMESILKEPEAQILVQELGSSTYNLTVYFWTNTHQYSLLKVASLAMKNVVSALDNAGISMPDDAREVIFPEGINVSMDKDGAGKYSAKKVDKFYEPVDAVKPKNKGEEDLSSDNDDIRRQADLARDPEQGSNIL